MDVEQTPQELIFKAGEADTVTFFYHEGDEDKTPVDISTAELNFQVRKKKTSEIVFEKTDTDFNKDEGANGLATVIIKKDDTKGIPAGHYTAEIRAIFDADDSVDKSIDIDFEVITPVHKDT